MTTFGWKRKIGENVSRKTADTFFDDTKDDNDVTRSPDSIDWIISFKKRKLALFEDCQSKSSRLKTEGEILAENERYWEAIKKWDEAIQLTPESERLHEMKAQALMQLNEIFPAVQAAERAVHLNPQWWVAYQTLGRAQLGIGEIKMAIQSFSKAAHINPAESELWKDDLEWALKLRKQKLDSESENCTESIEDGGIVFDEDGMIVEHSSSDKTQSLDSGTIILENAVKTTSLKL